MRPGNTYRRKGMRGLTKAILPMVAVLPMVLGGCFTGVESTPKITEGDVRKAHVGTKPETNYLDDVKAEPFAAWKPGKEFVCTDERVMRIFGASANRMSSLAGSTIRYAGAEEVRSFTGEPVVELRFSTPQGEVVYRTDISLDSIMRREAYEMPFISEQSRLDALKAKMKGHKYYVTTPIWHDAAGNRIRGVKYVSVEVTDVLAGSGVYPATLQLEFVIPATAGKESRPVTFYLPLSFETGRSATRTFADQFSLSDPRKRYPRITDSNWALIIRGALAQGMTRDECRLSLGSPSRVERRPGSTTLYERWTYEDGATLTFADGLLSSYRN